MKKNVQIPLFWKKWKGFIGLHGCWRLTLWTDNVGHLHYDSNLEYLILVTILKSSTLGCQQDRDTIMFMTFWCWQLIVSDNFWVFWINVGHHHVRVALMLVKSHRFRMLAIDLVHWWNHQHNEKSRQHNDCATKITMSPTSLSPHVRLLTQKTRHLIEKLCKWISQNFNGIK